MAINRGARLHRLLSSATAERPLPDGLFLPVKTRLSVAVHLPLFVLFHALARSLILHHNTFQRGDSHFLEYRYSESIVRTGMTQKAAYLPPPSSNVFLRNYFQQFLFLVSTRLLKFQWDLDES